MRKSRWIKRRAKRKNTKQLTVTHARNYYACIQFVLIWKLSWKLFIPVRCGWMSICWNRPQYQYDAKVCIIHTKWWKRARVERIYMHICIVFMHSDKGAQKNNIPCLSKHLYAMWSRFNLLADIRCRNVTYLMLVMHCFWYFSEHALNERAMTRS